MTKERRLIDANDVYSLFDKSGFARLHVSDIDTILRVDAVEVVHGRWEEYPDRFHVRCTNCRVEFKKNKFPSIRNYCPHCGAKMYGGINK